MRIVGAFFWATVAGLATASISAQTNEAGGPPRPPSMPQYRIVNNSVRLHELSPVAYFRVLLGMTPPQRAQALAAKSNEQREAILRKVKEYETLPADVREARLRQTELRWTLTDLMRVAPAARVERLRGMDPSDQQFLNDRLRDWDRLPVAEQKAYLEKQSFVSLYLRWEASSSAGQIEMINKLPPSTRAQWTNELARWQTLPEGARQAMSDRFSRFFAMDDREQSATVSALSDQERQQMQVSLRAFAALPPQQREICVKSFGKFATMSPDERGQFLRNATQWEEMTPQDRRLWRKLVQSLPPMPPMPLDFYRARPGGLPPAPPGFDSASRPASKNVYAQSMTN